MASGTVKTQSRQRVHHDVDREWAPRHSGGWPVGGDRAGYDQLGISISRRRRKLRFCCDLRDGQSIKVSWLAVSGSKFLRVNVSATCRRHAVSRRCFTDCVSGSNSTGRTGRTRCATRPRHIFPPASCGRRATNGAGVSGLLPAQATSRCQKLGPSGSEHNVQISAIERTLHLAGRSSVVAPIRATASTR